MGNNKVLALEWHFQWPSKAVLKLIDPDSKNIVHVATCSLAEDSISDTLSALADESFSFQPSVDSGELSISEFIFLELEQAQQEYDNV